MDRATLEGQYGYFRMVLGMSRLLLDQFPESALSLRPAPGMRSTAEIVSHNYTFLGDALETITQGTFVSTPEPEFQNKAEMLAYCDAQVAKMFRLFAGVTDAQLAKQIDAYGTTLTGLQFAVFAYDEHWHHRGQLTIHLRLAGVTPLMIYDYERLA